MNGTIDSNHNREATGHPSSPRQKGSFKGVAVGVLAAGILVVGLLLKRSGEHAQLVKETNEMATPTVLVVHPKPGPTEKEIVLTGNLTPFSEVSIFARTNGYVKNWSADLGAKVEEGALLAELEAPDHDAQLLGATASQAEAKANLENARLNFERQKELLNRKATSQQEFDRAKTSMDAMAAALQVKDATVQNLTVQKGFQKIVAPFPAVVTRRNTEVGALVSAGSGQELFHLARTDILRVFISVPQVYSTAIRKETPAYLEMLEFPGQKFSGGIVNISGALDSRTRTLLTEMQVPNAEGRLFPGAYARVHLKLAIEKAALILPSNTLVFRGEGTQVATVDAEGKVTLKKVTLGHDFGTEIEVTQGVTLNDSVILNPPDSISEGLLVHVETPMAAIAAKP